MIGTAEQLKDWAWHEFSERTRPLLERFSFSSQARIGWNGFRITGTLNRKPFLSDTSDLRTDDLVILRMRVIFQEDILACYSSILLNIRKCDNINILEIMIDVYDDALFARLHSFLKELMEQIKALFILFNF